MKVILRGFIAFLQTHYASDDSSDVHLSEELIEYNAVNSIVVLLDHLISNSTSEQEFYSDLACDVSSINDVIFDILSHILAMSVTKDSLFYSLCFVYLYQ